MKKKIIAFVFAILVGMAAMLQTGCGGAEPGSAADPKTEISNIKSALLKSKLPWDKEKRIHLLRSAYEASAELDSRWPDDSGINAFLTKNREKLAGIPEKVCAKSVEVADLDSFKWAIAHSVQPDTGYAALLKYWDLGPEWREHFAESHPESALPVFMYRALQTNQADFFNAHAEAFKQSGSALCAPIDPADFNARLVRFLGGQLKIAITEKNAERVDFLLDYMPPQNSGIPMDMETKLTMLQLGDFIFYELKDEALACKLVSLRYTPRKIDLAKSGFGEDFMEVLTADKAQAFKILQLDQWHGALSKPETLFLLSLQPEIMKKVDMRYLDETIALCLENKKNDLATRLISFRDETVPLKEAEYKALLGTAIQSGDPALFNFVLGLRKDMDLYKIDLIQLAGNYDLFVKHAPDILDHIAKMENDTEKGAAAALEEMRRVLASANHEAAMYLLKKYDLDKRLKTTASGRTLLMDLCEAGNLPAAKYLIEVKRADVNAITRHSENETTLFGRSDAMEGKLSAIHFAARSGNAELIKYLASKGADINAKTYYGATPLMYAVSSGHLEAAKALIALHANVNAIMDSGLRDEAMPEPGTFDQLASAYRRAETNRNTEMLDLLKKAGARP